MFYYQICQIISLFSSLAKQFVNYLNECPVDVFLQLGNLHHELTGTETRYIKFKDYMFILYNSSNNNSDN